jgi:hypothetical protein
MSQRSQPNFPGSHNGETFAQHYGTNRGKGRGARANAFGKCVSTIAHKTGNDAESMGRSSGGGGGAPALTCKEKRAHDLAGFQTSYGIRPNAFGKCVAAHANGTDADPPSSNSGKAP